MPSELQPSPEEPPAALSPAATQPAAGSSIAVHQENMGTKVEIKVGTPEEAGRILSGLSKEERKSSAELHKSFVSALQDAANPCEALDVPIMPGLEQPVASNAGTFLQSHVLVLHSNLPDVFDRVRDCLLRAIKPTHLRELRISSVEDADLIDCNLFLQLSRCAPELSREAAQDTLVRVVLDDAGHAALVRRSLRNELAGYREQLRSAKVLLLLEVRPVVGRMDLPAIEDEAKRAGIPFWFVDALPILVAETAQKEGVAQPAQVEAITRHLATVQQQAWNRAPEAFLREASDWAKSKGLDGLRSLGQAADGTADEEAIAFIEKAGPPERACLFLASFLPPLPVPTFTDLLVPLLLKDWDETVTEEKITESEGKKTVERIRRKQPASDRWSEEGQSIRRACGLRASVVDELGNCLSFRDPSRKLVFRTALLVEFTETVSRCFARIRESGLLLDLDQPRELTQALIRLAGEMAVLFPGEFGQKLLTAHVQAFREMAGALVRAHEPEEAAAFERAENLLDVVLAARALAADSELRQRMKAHADLRKQLNRLLNRLLHRLADICHEMLESGGEAGLRIVEQFLNSLVAKSLHAEAVTLTLALRAAPAFPFWKWALNLFCQVPEETLAPLHDRLVVMAHESPAQLAAMLEELRGWLPEGSPPEPGKKVDPAPWFALVCLYRFNQAMVEQFFDAKTTPPLPPLPALLTWGGDQDGEDAVTLFAGWLTHTGMPLEKRQERRKITASLLVDWLQMANAAQPADAPGATPAWLASFRRLLHAVRHHLTPAERFQFPSDFSAIEQAEMERMPGFLDDSRERVAAFVAARRAAVWQIIGLLNAPDSDSAALPEAL